MIDQELLPLAILKADDEGGVDGRTHMQKLVFLMQEESDDAASRLPDIYTYVPYDYGPFARELYDDLDRLKAKEVIEEGPIEMADSTIEYDYRLGEDADEYLRDIPDQKLERTLEIARRIKSGFNDEELPSLINYVYNEYPEYAENSVL